MEMTPIHIKCLESSYLTIFYLVPLILNASCFVRSTMHLIVKNCPLWKIVISVTSAYFGFRRSWSSGPPKPKIGIQGLVRIREGQKGPKKSYSSPNMIICDCDKKSLLGTVYSVFFTWTDPYVNGYEWGKTDFVEMMILMMMMGPCL